MDNWFNIIDLKNKSKKAINSIKKLSREGVNRNIVHENHNYSLLALSIKFQNYNAFKLLMQKNADVNGKKNGITFTTPLSQCYHFDNIIKNKKMIDTLLLNGAYLNLVGIDGKNLLYNMIDELFQHIERDVKFIKKYIKLIIYILSKGIDINKSYEFLPFNLLVEKINVIRNDSPILVKYLRLLVDNFVYYGGNPYQTDYNGVCAYNLIIEHKDIRHNKKIFKNIITDIHEIIKKKSNTKIVDKIAKALKIPILDEDKKNKKRLCKCITYVKKNQEHLNYENYKNIRHKRRKLNKSSNQQLITSFNDISEFLEDELILYTDPDDNKLWTFHVSEVPMLLKDRMNNWTKKKIDSKILKNIYHSYNFFPEYILEESINTIFDKQSVIELNINTKFEQINRLCNTIDPYLNVTEEILNKWPESEIYELFCLFYEVPNFSMNWNTVRNLHISKSKNQLIELLYDIIILNLRNSSLALHTLTHMMNQISKDYKLVIDIVKIIGGYEMFNDVKYYFKYNAFTDKKIAGKRNIENGKLIGYEGGIFITPEMAMDISDLISIRLNMNNTDSNTSIFIDNYWKELLPIFDRL